MSDEIRLKILRILAEEPEISQRALASRLGISLGKANYCVRALVDKGFIKAKNFRNNKNKASYLYMLTPGGILNGVLTIVSIAPCSACQDDLYEVRLI